MLNAARALPWVAAVALGVAAEWVPYGLPGYGEPILDLFVGWALIGSGLVMHARRRAPWSATLMVAAGVAWFLPNFAVTGIGAVDAPLSSVVLVHIALLAFAILVLPSGELRGAAAWAAAAAVVAVAVAGATGGGRFVLPPAGVVFVVASFVVWRRAAHRSEPAELAALLAAVIVGGELVTGSLSRSLIGVDAVQPAARAHEVAVVLAAVIVVLAATSRPRYRHAIELEVAGGGEMRVALARVLGDSELSLAFPDGADGWVDPLGRPCAVPRENVRGVRDGAELVAVMGTTAAIGPNMREPLTEVLSLAGENARLRRSVMRQLGELAASRRRLLEAGDAERRQLEAQLRRGALARLGAIAAELAVEQGHEGLLAQVAKTRSELEDIGHGLDPLARGETLREALGELAARARQPVDVSIAGGPLAEDVERAIWFACAEAVANAAKYAPGAAVTISVAAGAGEVVATITDDGPGGADRSGLGLRGLADRASVIGGSLAVTSDPGHGTRIVLRLPTANEGQRVDRSWALGDVDAVIAP